jgi:hypothetical protein
MSRGVWPVLALSMFVGTVGFSTSLAVAESTTQPADSPKEKPKKADLKTRHLPGAVKRAFKRDFPSNKILSAVRETYSDGTVQYVLTYSDKNRQDQKVRYDDEGNQIDATQE